jgi:hypothetical protein
MEFGTEVPDNWYSYVSKPVCEHEDQRMWNMKYFVIPVVIGGIGTVTQRTEEIPGRNTRQAFHRFTAKKLPSWEHRTY